MSACIAAANAGAAWPGSMPQPPSHLRLEGKEAVMLGAPQAQRRHHEDVFQQVLAQQAGLVKRKHRVG